MRPYPVQDVKTELTSADLGLQHPPSCMLMASFLKTLPCPSFKEALIWHTQIPEIGHGKLHSTLRSSCMGFKKSWKNVEQCFPYEVSLIPNECLTLCHFPSAAQHQVGMLQTDRLKESLPQGWTLGRVEIPNCIWSLVSDFSLFRQ